MADRVVEEWIGDDPARNSLARLNSRSVWGIDGNPLCADQNQNVTTGC